MYVECKRKKRNDWIIRLTEHIKANKNCTYVTLTFSEESIKNLNLRIHKNITGYERENAIATLAVRNFTERWRKKYKKTLKHWLITELGTTRTERIHLHGIVESKNIKDIEEKWSYGYVKCGTYVNEKTIAYITKYMLKTDIKHKTYKPVILASKGIGKAYINTAAAQARKFNGEKTTTG